jgi:putative Mn2+ efflux pump MntP
MGWIAILGIAIALAMDAFAVAIAVSVTLGRPTGRQLFRLSFHFGWFQFMMPVIGWFAGRSVLGWIEAWDHWVAFGLLAFIGGKMIYEGFTVVGGRKDRKADPTRGLSLVALSTATSVDALAAGFTFALVGVDVWYPAVLIGGVAGLLTLLGMKIGGRLGARFGKRMEIAGGLVLISIGIKILADHLLG